MNSTDPATNEADALKRFHRKWIAPLAARGIPPLAQREGQGEADSLFVQRRHTRMRPEDFDLALSDPKRIVAALQAQWAGTPMQSMVKPFVKLARRFERYEQRADVSSNIYEMF